MHNGNSDVGDDCLRGDHVAGSGYHAGPPSSGACGFQQRNPNSRRSPNRHAHHAIQNKKARTIKKVGFEVRINARAKLLIEVKGNMRKRKGMLKCMERKLG